MKLCLWIPAYNVSVPAAPTSLAIGLRSRPAPLVDPKKLEQKPKASSGKHSSSNSSSKGSAPVSSAQLSKEEARRAFLNSGRPEHAWVSSSKPEFEKSSSSFQSERHEFTPFSDDNHVKKSEPVRQDESDSSDNPFRPFFSDSLGEKESSIEERIEEPAKEPAPQKAEEEKKEDSLTEPEPASALFQETENDPRDELQEDTIGISMEEFARLRALEAEYERIRQAEPEPEPDPEPAEKPVLKEEPAALAENKPEAEEKPKPVFEEEQKIEVISEPAAPIEEPAEPEPEPEPAPKPEPAKPSDSANKFVFPALLANDPQENKPAVQPAAPKEEPEEPEQPAPVSMPDLPAVEPKPEPVQKAPAKEESEEPEDSDELDEDLTRDYSFEIAGSITSAMPFADESDADADKNKEEAPKLIEPTAAALDLEASEPLFLRHLNSGVMIRIGDHPLRIGTSSACDYIIEFDQSVSREHALARNVDGHIYIEDLGSTNQTFINCFPIRKNTEMKPGQILRLGLYQVFQLVRYGE